MSEYFSLGSHITVRRLLGFYHHGIVTGFDEVTHLSKIDGQNPKVRQTSLQVFSRGAKISTVSGGIDYMAVRRARRGWLEGREYDFLGYNCEHFARESKYGVAWSKQVTSAERNLRRAAYHSHRMPQIIDGIGKAISRLL